jgi:ubiquinone/menaquinone biosynthesis C-methylase UbiE
MRKLTRAERRRRFETAYSHEADVHLAVEREVFGAVEGMFGFTTVAQADLIARRLSLDSSSLLLDIGSGRGWPAVYLVRTSGCRALLTDVPQPGLRTARARAIGHDVAGRCSFVRASGAHLPFRARTCDAVVHTDVL